MLIGNDFSNKNQHYLKTIKKLSNEETDHKISVRDLNNELNLDRTELKNVLEYLEGLGFIEIATIGGPFLYGHITITEKGIEKASSL